jgi:hypothetical protein
LCELFGEDAQEPLTVAAMNFDESKMRDHMIYMLENKKLVPFPKASTPQPRVQRQPTWFVLDRNAKCAGPFDNKEAAVQWAHMMEMLADVD